MIICGLKLTHDGAVAVLEDDRLLFSVEMEKLDNNPRHQPVRGTEEIVRVLNSEGLDVDAVDRFVIDGWHARQSTTAARIEIDGPLGTHALSAAPYAERTAREPCAQRFEFDGLVVGGRTRTYSGYRHATGHAFAAYCTSPFAARDESSLVLVWDGGMLPHLYEFARDASRIVNTGPLFMMFGNAFSEFCAHFEPFTYALPNAGVIDRSRPSDVAGKAMAYAALGTTHTSVLTEFETMLDELNDVSIDAASKLAQVVLRRRDSAFPHLSNADLICSFQAFLGKMLVTSLDRFMQRRSRRGPSNLCFVGGCALNIKWNSLLRANDHLDEMWIPPFPNDAGSAIGVACAELATIRGEVPPIEWHVKSGPKVVDSSLPAGWATRECSIDALASLLATQREPVVIVDGRAELGPRALGSRSIVAPADSPEMKDKLNRLKAREDYRPVAPICLESRAAEVFDPGCTDPYMLFDHHVREEYADRIPAVLHVDGTARLQTVNRSNNSVAFELLTAYDRLTGVPVLCNTSANNLGRGFFPDVGSAARWGGVRYVWSAGTLFFRSDDHDPGIP